MTDENTRASLQPSVVEEMMEAAFIEGYGCAVLDPEADYVTEARTFWKHSATKAALAAQPRDDVREALGAHIHADAYRDTMPDDDNDAAYLRKQETWWRLQARAWLNGEVVHACAELAKKRATNAPEHKAAVAQALARIDTALAPTTQPDMDGLAGKLSRFMRGTDKADALESHLIPHDLCYAILTALNARPTTQGTDSGLTGPHPMSAIWAEAFHAWEEHGHWQACDVLAKHFACTDHKAVLEEAAKVADDFAKTIAAMPPHSEPHLTNAEGWRRVADAALDIRDTIRALAEGDK